MKSSMNDGLSYFHVMKISLRILAITVCILFASAPSLSHGQTNQEESPLDAFDIGISVGSNASLIRTKGLFALLDPQLAFGVGLASAGVEAHIQIMDEFYLRPEARLNIRTLQGKLGLLVENEGTIELAFFKTRLRDVWLEFPLLGEVRVDKNISAYLGLQGSVLMASRASVQEEIPLFYTLQGDASTNRNSLEFGYVLGGTIRLDSGLGIGGRLFRSFSNVYDYRQYGDLKAKYTILQIYATFAI